MRPLCSQTKCLTDRLHLDINFAGPAYCLVFYSTAFLPENQGADKESKGCARTGLTSFPFLTYAPADGCDGYQIKRQRRGRDGTARQVTFAASFSRRWTSCRRAWSAAARSNKTRRPSARCSTLSLDLPAAAGRGVRSDISLLNMLTPGRPVICGSPRHGRPRQGRETRLPEEGGAIPAAALAQPRPAGDVRAIERQPAR